MGTGQVYITNVRHHNNVNDDIRVKINKGIIGTNEQDINIVK